MTSRAEQKVVTNPDAFLRRFFLLQDRASSPRCVSAEAVVRGTLEQALEAEAWRAWSLAIIARVEREVGARAVEVARHYYMGLSNAHFSIVARTGGAVSTREVGHRATPDEAADLQSFCDWRRVALAVCGADDAPLQRACREALLDVRVAVSMELARRQDGPG